MSVAEEASKSVGSDSEADYGEEIADKGEEIDSVNCESICEQGSAISSLFDDTSVNSSCDRRAKIELGVLFGRFARPSSQAIRLLTEPRKGKAKAKRRLLRCARRTRILESSEEEAEQSSIVKHRRRFRRVAMTSSGVDGSTASKVSPASGKEQGDTPRNTEVTRYIHLKHPLSGTNIEGKPKDDANYGGDMPQSTGLCDAPEKRPRYHMKEMVLRRNGEEEAGTDNPFSSSPSLGAGCHVAVAVSPGQQYFNNPAEAHCTTADFRSAAENSGAAFVNGASRKTDHARQLFSAKVAGERSSIVAVEGYNPVVGEKVKVVYQSKWELSNFSAQTYSELERMIDHGEGFNSAASAKLLQWQKNLVFENVIGQANLHKAREHWRHMKHGITLGKKERFVEHYERLMYCLFMQDCTSVSAAGELCMTKRSRLQDEQKIEQLRFNQQPLPHEGAACQPPQLFHRETDHHDIEKRNGDVRPWSNGGSTGQGGGNVNSGESQRFIDNPYQRRPTANDLGGGAMRQERNHNGSANQRNQGFRVQDGSGYSVGRDGGMASNYGWPGQGGSAGVSAAGDQFYNNAGGRCAAVVMMF